MKSSNSTHASVLISTDNVVPLRSLELILRQLGCHVEFVATGSALLQRVCQEPVPDLAFLDLKTEDSASSMPASQPSGEALEALRRLRRLRPELKVAVLTSAAGVGSVVEAVRSGAQDYLMDPADAVEVRQVLDRVLAASPVALPVSEAVAMAESDSEFGFIAASPAMRKIRMQAVLLANMDTPLLMVGESGTGKEMIARLIHRLSARSRFAFHKLNCAALPDDLLETELFGCGDPFLASGRPGKLQVCRGGTLLLDEICDLPLALQDRLLQVLPDPASMASASSPAPGVAPGRAARARESGDRDTRNLAANLMNVRIFAACQGGVEQAMQEGRLREALHRRLTAFTMQLPPLRERQTEIPLLLHQFVERLAPLSGKPVRTLPAAMIERAQRHPWPGNLREMESFVRRYLLLGEEVTVESPGRGGRPFLAAGGIGMVPFSSLASFPTPVPTYRSPSRRGLAPTSDIGGPVTLRGLRAEAEADAISRALETMQWNRKQAARLLNISYRGLLYKMRQFGITEARKVQKLDESDAVTSAVTR